MEQQHQAVLEKAQVLSEISQQTIYLMGSSFVLGSMFTLLLLLVLDWIRRDKIEK
jgi:hypothetical protein